MKDKLTKRNIKKVDYTFRRCGSFGCALFVLSLAVLLPIKNDLTRDNVALVSEIENLENKKEETITNLRQGAVRIKVINQASASKEVVEYVELGC